MASPETIAAGASCFTCIPNKQEAIIYLLAQIAGVTDPATIAAGASCYTCIPNKQEAILFLLDAIMTGGGGGGGGTGCMLETNGDPEGVLTSNCTPALAVDPATSAIYLFTGVAGTNTGWALKV